MAEVRSNVYDLLYPSPISLMKLASIKAAAELWRLEIRKHREHNTLHQFGPQTNVPVNDIPLTLSSGIADMLDWYIKSMGVSIHDWLKRMRRYTDNILKYFDDFVCDFDGTIDDVQTAKRIIYCDGFSSDLKFRIACDYCLQSDVMRLWPSVSNSMALQKICFSTETKLCYWIFYLRKELHIIHNIDETMINTRCISDRSSMEYIWENCSNPESRFRMIRLLVSNYPKLFTRYILTRLNEDNLEDLACIHGSNLIISMLENNLLNCIIPTWLYIKDNIDEVGFDYLIGNFLKNETCSKFQNGDEYETMVKIYCNVWLTAPNDLKFHVLRNLPYLANVYNRFRMVNNSASPNRKFKFLMQLLSDLNLEARNYFWLLNWRLLIEGSKLKYLYPLMNFCFRNENEIKEFNSNISRKDEWIERHWTGLLRQARFEELNDFFNFIYSDDRTIKDIKRRLLKMNFLINDSVLKKTHFDQAQLMKEFIDSAFDDADEVANFKTLLLTSPSNMKILTSLKPDVLPLVMNFVDTLVPSQKVEILLKKRLKEMYTWKCDSAGSRSFESNDEISAFMLWCSADC